MATETDMAETFKMHVPLEGDESGSTLCVGTRGWGEMGEPWCPAT